MRFVKSIFFIIAGIMLLANASGVLNVIYLPVVAECGFHFSTACSFALLVVPAVILGAQLIDRGLRG